MADNKTTWVAGRTRESADGLGRRPQNEREAQRMREAAEAAESRQKAAEEAHYDSDGD